MARWNKPTLNTKFHIDFEWWDKQERDLRVYLHQHLCKSCREMYTSHLGSETVDWIDADTAEVHPVDGLWHALRTHCRFQPDYVSDATPLTVSVFRVFLANGNKPLTPLELGAETERSPEMILRVIGRGRVHNGVRPLSPGEEE